MIRDVNILSETIGSNNQNHNKHRKLGHNTKRSLTRYSIIDFDKISPCRLKIKNDRFQEPFIFFGKTIYGTLNIINGINYYISAEPIVHYEYVAFNKGFPPLKTAGFKKIGIHPHSYASSNYSYSFPDAEISEIPKEALIQLRNFILEQRNPEDQTFCKTIFNAVVEVVGPPQ